MLQLSSRHAEWKKISTVTVAFHRNGFYGCVQTRRSWARVSGAKLVTTFPKILDALTATKEEGEIPIGKIYHFYMNNKCTGTLTSQETNLEPTALELSHTCFTAVPLVL